MKSFSNNQHLLDYLLGLGSELKKRGLHELSELVVFASRQGSGLSTEFLGESRIALRQVLQRGSDALSKQELHDLQAALEQLDKALDER
jgi:hypothetical protein